MSSAAANPYEQWTAISDVELTTEHIHSILEQAQDDLWVAAACVDRIVDDIPVQQALLETGLSRTNAALERCKGLSASSSAASLDDAPETSNNTLVAHFRSTPADAQLCYFRSLLLKRLDLLKTYVEMQKEVPLVGDEEPAGKVEEQTEDEEEDGWDDPWATDIPSSPISKSMKPAPLPIPLSTFLTNDLLWSACELASMEWFGALQVLLDRHNSYLWPLHLMVLDCIPEHTPPSDFQPIALKFDFPTERELKPASNPWRSDVDFSETEVVQRAIQDSGLSLPIMQDAFTLPTDSSPRPEPLTADELTTWYKNRVDKVITTTGMVDIALALIQHGASQGIPDLDELGEELSLLSRLVYDTPRAEDASEDWTLARWYNMDPPSVIRAYLAQSTPESLPKDISRLVMPYLYVLEARAERAGAPDPELPNRLLYGYVLTCPLELAASIFEASKPTLPAPQRIIKNDEDLARIALACLYGSSSLDEWSTMSRIFECLPAWDYPRDEDNDEDAADTTMISLGSFVTPTTTHPRVSPTELMAFFKPLHVASLSRALDILDVHLMSGEIFSRWGVAAPLKWFLQSNDDAKEQRAWANRMARRAGGTNDQLNTIDDWQWLLEDMIKLTGKSDTGIRNAFGLLSEEEVARIFLSGLLSTGRFEIARSLLYGPHIKTRLEPATVEEICIASSRELYDNASSGNYKVGDMKLAYDCLNVPPPSHALLREKDFIEATSRICSFNVTSRPGIPISPIEIRLTKDRLSLISRVLSSNNDAYKHTEVMLDLCFKLGFRNDITAKVKTLAMLADTALQAEDFARAYENTMEMVEAVRELRESSGASASIFGTEDKFQEATEVCWIGCFQLGRQPEYDDLENKMQLLGYALELCPPEKLHDVLLSWHRLSKEDIDNREEYLALQKQERQDGKHRTSLSHSIKHEHTHVSLMHGWSSASAMTSATLNTATSSLRAKLQQIHMPSPQLLSTPDAAALASRTFRSVAANFPFSVGGQRSTTPSQASSHGRQEYNEYDQEQHERRSHYGSSESASRRFDVEEVSSKASKALSKGIGWLIGADE